MGPKYLSDAQGVFTSRAGRVAAKGARIWQGILLEQALRELYEGGASPASAVVAALCKKTCSTSVL
jgi:hypothetical protein